MPSCRERLAGDLIECLIRASTKGARIWVVQTFLGGLGACPPGKFVRHARHVQKQVKPRSLQVNIHEQ